LPTSNFKSLEYQGFYTLNKYAAVPRFSSKIPGFILFSILRWQVLNSRHSTISKEISEKEYPHFLREGAA